MGALLRHGTAEGAVDSGSGESFSGAPSTSQSNAQVGSEATKQLAEDKV